jgi:hypothetical protein
MEDKETEKVIEKSIKDIKMKSFSARWAEIKDRLPEKKKRPIWIKRLSAIAASVCGIVALAIILPLSLNKAQNQDIPTETTYFALSDILADTVTEEEFFAELREAKINTIDFSKLNLDVYSLAKTRDSVVRGGKIAFDNLEETEEYVYIITFYNETVSVDSNYSDLKTNVNINGIDIKYETKEDEIYESTAFVKYKDITYIIEYSSLNDDLIDFLNILFAEDKI